MRLVYDATNEEVKVGDKVKDFRGDPCEVIEIIEPHKPSSTGRVELKLADGFTHAYFPGVINATWIEREDHPSEEYERAYDKASAATNAFYKAKKAYHKREIDSDTYAEVFKVHCEAQKEFDLAFEKEQNRYEN